MGIKDQGEWDMGTMNGAARVTSMGETLQVSLHCPCGCGKAWHFAGRWDNLPALQAQFEVVFALKSWPGLDITSLAIQAAGMHSAITTAEMSDTSMN